MLIVVAIIAVLFGGSRIPKFARGLGSAKREFERGLEEGADPSADGSHEHKAGS